MIASSETTLTVEPLDPAPELPPDGPVSAAPAVAPPQTTPNEPDPTFGGVLGQLHTLSPDRQAKLVACESVLASGCTKFAEIGRALGQIRDEGLFEAEFETFENYCRSKWQYGRRYVYYIISAARIHHYLCTNCAQTKPERESQIRPLLALLPEQALLAWECALGFAGGRKITTKLIKQALHELGFSKKEVAVGSGPTKRELRKVVQDGVTELFTLITQKSSYDILLPKIERLHCHVQSLFPTRPKAKLAHGGNNPA
jgi:hypothetical protein